MNNDIFPLSLLSLGSIILLVCSLFIDKFFCISVSLLFIFIIFLIDSGW